MKRSSSTLALAALFALAACGKSEPEVVDMNPDPQAAELAKAKPVELPPAIQTSRAYRCKDNSLVYIDFYTNNTAMVRKAKGEEPPIATLTAPAAGQPYAANGYSVSGNGTTVTYEAPGKAAQECKA